MKNKTWVLIFAAAAVLCLVLSLPLLLPGEPAKAAQIWSEGELLYTFDLSVDRTVVVESSLGTNEITIKDGYIGVTAADCPDHYCMDRGFCHSGSPIVCLPNRLVIEFVGEQEIDGVAG